MKLLKLMAGVLLITFTLNVKAQAGSGSHGGGAFICANPAQSEFFDLWESERPHVELCYITPGPFSKKTECFHPSAALHIPQFSDPVDVQIQNAFDKLKGSRRLYEDVMKVYEEVKKARIIPVPGNVDLAWPRDEDNKYIKKDCSAKAIILFHDEDHSMDLDLNSLKGLSNTQQAAVWVHETIYKFLRQNQREYLREDQQDKSSLRARNIVGHLFSDETIDVIQDKLKDIAGFYFGNRDGLHAGPIDNDPQSVSALQSLNYFAAYPGQPVHLEADFVVDRQKSDRRCRGIEDKHHVRVTEVHKKDDFAAYMNMSNDKNALTEPYLDLFDDFGDFFRQKRPALLSCYLKATYEEVGGHGEKVTLDLGGLTENVNGKRWQVNRWSIHLFFNLQ